MGIEWPKLQKGVSDCIYTDTIQMHILYFSLLKPEIDFIYISWELDPGRPGIHDTCIIW